MARLSDLLVLLDPDPRVRGRQFELISKWYLQNDPQYKLQLRKVWLWEEWPDRWGPDAGIDLVAETYDSKLWAIQAKAYSSRYSVTKKDVDTFLSESSRTAFSYRLIIATTNRIGHTGQNTLYGQEKAVGRILLSDLLKSDLSWPKAPGHLIGEPPQPKRALPHQLSAIEAVISGFKEHDRGQLLMACGTGKTLVSLRIAESLQSQRTLVLVPSLSLLAQTMREWASNTRSPFRFLPVCSDDTVRGQDDFVSKVTDIVIPATTDAEEVVDFLSGSGRRVVFATYQSSSKIVEAFEFKEIPLFDLVIADEAHRCVGPAGGPFASILDSTAIGAHRRLFMTATPRYFTNRVRREADQNDLEIASMDDEGRFGPVFHSLKFSEAIHKDLLTNYRVLIVPVDDPTYRRYAEEGTFVTTDGKKITDARTLASHIACIEAIRNFGLRRVISFHGRIKRAKEFSKDLPKVVEWIRPDLRPPGQLWSKHVDGMMPSGKRDALLDRFRNIEPGETGFLANARCLAEGVDLPALDGVAFIDPKHSPIDIIQAVGRVIRKSPEKEIGTVLIPVFIDIYADGELALESSAFKPVWDVLKALRAHDDELAEQLDNLRRDLGRRGRREANWPDKVVLKLPISLDPSFAEAFKTAIVQRSTDSWEFWFGKLQAFVERVGHSRVPGEYETEDNYKLGIWVGNQRRLRRKLLMERKEALESLPGWTWNPFEDAWLQGFDRLLAYSHREGHSRVPQLYRTSDGFALGSWVTSQRTRRNRLSKTQCQALESVPGWIWHTVEAAWSEGITKLREFYSAEGHPRVPFDFVTEDGFGLGAWVSRQRVKYRKKQLSVKRQSELESISGWIWDLNEESWLHFFTCLKEFVNDKGHSRVPHNFVTRDGSKLGQWVVNQRCRKETLTNDQIQALEAIPDWTWDTHQSDWLRGLHHLQDYLQREGHLRVPTDYKAQDGFGLWIWITNQRRKRSRLTKRQVQLLENVPGWMWRPFDDSWNEGFEHLSHYCERKGHTRVPQRNETESGFKLGLWVSNQRARRRGLTEEQRQALEGMPGWVWTPREADWLDGLSRLREFVDTKGHARVEKSFQTEDGFRLGAWASRLRGEYRKGRLALNKIEILEGFSGWIWDKYLAERQASLESLRRYSDREGHTRVPKGYVDEHGIRLGAWVDSQRQRRQMLTSEQRQTLESMPGWVWTPREADWLEGLSRLKEYVRKHGTAVVRGHYVTEDGFRLGGWVAHRRARRSSLAEEHRLALESLPGWRWNTKETQWNDKLNLLKEYAEREGHTSVPRSFVTEDGVRLGDWVQKQRGERRRSLSVQLRKALEEVPGWFWTIQDVGS